MSWKTYRNGEIDFDILRQRLHESAGKGDNHSFEMTTDEACDIAQASYAAPLSSGAHEVRRRIYESVEIEEQTGKEEKGFNCSEIKEDLPF